MTTTTALAERKLAPAGKLTFEEFLDWCDEDLFAEWVEGRVIIFSPVPVLHQQLSGSLLILLDFFVTMHALVIVFMAPTLR